MKEQTTLRDRLTAITASTKLQQMRTRVAAAWTLARTLLPSAPEDVQYKMANSLLDNSTQALTASLRQTAINAHYTRTAEKFEKAFKVELNELLEDEKFLAKMQGDVEKELKGEAKNASAEDCKCGGKGCENCKTAAPEDEKPVDEKPSEPTEEVPSDLPNPEEHTDEPVEEPKDETLPEEDSLEEPLPEEPLDEGTAIPDPIKESLEDKIETLEADVDALEETIEGEEDLDFSKIFDQDNMDEKVDSLANEEPGDELTDDAIEAAGSTSFFTTDSEEMEDQLDETPEVSDIADFMSTASVHNASSMDALLGKDAVVERGALTSNQIKKGDTLDAEEDHDGSLLFEVLGDLKPTEYPNTKRETAPDLQPAPKVAGKQHADIRPKQVSRTASGKPMRLGNVRQASTAQANLASLLFGDDPEM